MPDRTTKVTLTADTSGYVAGLDKAANATSKLADGSKSKLEQHSKALQTIGVGALAIGTAAAAGVALAVSKFAEFDKAMSGVQAATHESSQNMGLLRAASIKAGADTVFSATEAANAVEELSKAGLSTADVLGGALTGSLSLASAGELGVAEAAGIMSTALTQFHQPGSAASHVADLLAAGAGKAMGSVQDLSMALNQGGLVASQAGMSIEETTGTLAAFASAGLLGSDAGTSLKTMLLALEKPSAIAAGTMDKYGISVNDSNGHMLSMSAMAGQLQDKLGTLSSAERNAALATIFGTDAVRSASVLYDQGADGIQGWIDKTNDAGYAAETARLKLDNLSGDIEQLGGSIDTALIQSGSGANDILRTLTQNTTGLINGIGQLPAPVLGTGLAIAGLVAGVGLLGGGFLTLVPRIAATKVAMHDLNITGAGVAKTFGKGGLILAGITAVVGAMSEMGLEVGLTADQLASLNAIMKTGHLTELNKEFVNAQGGVASFGDAMNSLFTADFWTSYDGGPRQINGAIKGISFGMIDLGKGMDENRAKFKELGKQLGDLAKTDFPAASSQFNEFVKLAGGGKEAVRQATKAFPDYVAALRAMASEQGVTLTGTELLNLAQGRGKLATELAKHATEDNSGALAAMSGKARDASGDISKLSDQINNFGKGALDVSSATSAFEAAIDDAAAAVEKNGATLDITTEKGRDNQAALDDIAKSALGLASSQSLAGASSDTLTGTIARGREAFINAAIAAGKTREAAEKLADQYGLIPENVTTAITANTEPATAALNSWLKANANHRVNVAIGAGGTGGITRATGGILPGAPSNRDNMLINAASGEFITRASQTAIPENRRALEFINAGGVIPGYATGGTVGFQPAPVYTPAPPRMYMPGPGAGSVTREGDTFNVYETERPVATAQAIQRRQHMKAAV